MEDKKLDLQDYNHENFTVAGYNYLIHYADFQKEMTSAWDDIKSSDKLTKIQKPKSGSLHAIYYNVTPSSFDMLVGFWVDANDTQNADIKIIEIPEQNYKFGEFDFTGPESVAKAWEMINKIPRSEIARTMKYDLEMYSEDMKKFWIAVGI